MDLMTKLPQSRVFLGIHFYAARLIFRRPRLTRSSAICMVFSAAPLRRLSDTNQRLRAFSKVLSSRIREI